MKVINKFLQESDRSFAKKDSVKCLVFCPAGKLLIMRRQMGEGGEGQWDIPGGAVEKNENEQDALRRETFEESGLKINNIKKVKSVKFKIPEQGIDSIMHIYRGDSEGIDVQLKPANWKGSNGRAEHIEIKWIQKKIDLENLPMIKELKDVVMKQLK